MSSRFYLTSTGSAPASPAFSAGWENTTIAVRLPTYTTVQSTTLTSFQFFDSNTSDQDILLAQYVSETISAQTIAAQTVKLQIRAHERSGNNNMFITLNIKVVSGDGSTERGTVLSMQRDDVEVAAAGNPTQNRALSAISSSVTALDGDRLVFEIGLGGDPVDVGGDHDSEAVFGDAGASDLPEDDTTTTDLNPWVEFANTVTFFTSPSASVSPSSSLSPSSSASPSISPSTSLSPSSSASASVSPSAAPSTFVPKVTFF